MRSSIDPVHNVLNLFEETATHYYSEKQGYQTLLRFLLLNVICWLEKYKYICFHFGGAITPQIVKCIHNFVHQMEGIVLMALLQQYKSVADFLQAVASKKDQTQCWAHPSTPYSLIPVAEFVEAFSQSRYGNSIKPTPPIPYDKTICHLFDSTKYDLRKWELFKTCFVREVMLIHRRCFLHNFKTCQKWLDFSCRLNDGQHPFGLSNIATLMNITFHDFNYLVEVSKAIKTTGVVDTVGITVSVIGNGFIISSTALISLALLGALVSRAPLPTVLRSKVSISLIVRTIGVRTCSSDVDSHHHIATKNSCHVWSDTFLQLQITVITPMPLHSVPLALHLEICILHSLLASDLSSLASNLSCTSITGLKSVIIGYNSSLAQTICT
ncbi:hypothetical protein Nepgr_022713 [Nepenthes gracilis]|uniref:Uncharacterized protein n=1 Tax=Nepenthes gracilis TaxID=150966 RepID=A0AAD3T337_NEPGR|nr:hypothetical protein Nepgr_022713 [Nepenthes gracilis]